jgi:hypothetical protein
VIRDILLLVDVDVPVETIMGWTCQQRDLAEDWAAAQHLVASDNDDIEIPPKPDFLPPSETEKRMQAGYAVDVNGKKIILELY